MAVKKQSLLVKRRAKIFTILIIFTAILISTPLYFFADARHSGFFPRCPFFMITGFLCPGCGSQRSVSSLLHGDIKQALHFNVLLVASLPFLLYSSAVGVMNVFRTKIVIQKIFYSPVFVKIVFAVVMLFWVLRNIPVYPFTILSGQKM